ncbi:MAG: response regulator [Actinomycetota bacterium]
MELLLVEDDPLQEALYRRVFERVVDRLHIAGSVADATSFIEAAATGRAPDVVVVDVMLNLESGFDVLDVLRRLPHFATVPVVVWSTSVRPEYVERCRFDEHCVVVSKPFGIDELAAFASEIATVGELAAGSTAARPFRFGDHDFGGFAT